MDLLRSPNRAVMIGVGAVFGIAATATESRGDASPLVVVGVFFVGMSFIVAAVFSPLGTQVRWLTALPGVFWWIGSLIPALGQAYLWWLILLLASFPRGRPSRWGWLMVIASLPAWLGVLDRWMVASLIGGVALEATSASRQWRARRWAAWSATGLSVLVGSAFVLDLLAPGRIHPRLVIEVIMLALVAVATSSLVAARELLAAADHAAVVALGEGESGLAGLRGVLRAVTGDPTIDVVIVDEAASPEPAPGRAVLAVPYSPGRTAYVLHRPDMLTDPAMRSATAQAVALTVTNVDVRNELSRRRRAAEAARARSISALDRQRREVARRLSTEVVPHLEAAADALVDINDPEAPALRATLLAAREEVATTVAGTAVADLGRGGLVGALTERVASYRVPVTVDAAAWHGADPGTESTLFYFCSEAVVNAVKHSGASRIQVRLRSVGDSAVAVVTDDGRGGADPRGHGLSGLADRVAARGGRLRVECPPRAGTVVMAELPISRSSSTG